MTADGQVVAANGAGNASAETVRTGADTQVTAAARQAASDGVVGASSLLVSARGADEAVDFTLVPVLADDGTAS